MVKIRRKPTMIMVSSSRHNRSACHTARSLRSATMIQLATRIASADAARMTSGRNGSADKLLPKTDPIRSEGQR